MLGLITSILLLDLLTVTKAHKLAFSGERFRG